jgi:DNA mismatch endonuclease (patch repair protein)
MTDKPSPGRRSRLMSRVTGRDTKPEWIVRSTLHRLGFRYRLGGAELPGRPDLVLPKYRAALFVHGCFWHAHADCKRASLPKTNASFWQQKLDANVARDRRNQDALTALGWRVIVVWECDLYRDPVAAVGRIVGQLTGQPAGTGLGYHHRLADLERHAVLGIAERKRRYRLGPKPLDSEKNETYDE